MQAFLQECGWNPEQISLHVRHAAPFPANIFCPLASTSILNQTGRSVCARSLEMKSDQRVWCGAPSAFLCLTLTHRLKLLAMTGMRYYSTRECEINTLRSHISMFHVFPPNAALNYMEKQPRGRRPENPLSTSKDSREKIQCASIYRKNQLSVHPQM